MTSHQANLKEFLMPNYVAYPKAKDTPNRKNRKSSRNTVFQKNRKANKGA